MAIKVVLIDDHLHVHDAVSAILATTRDITLVGQGSNGHEALSLCERLEPDLVLMDVVMPVMNGIEATALIRQKYPHIKILVLSSFQDHESIYSMLDSGADGYVIKGALAHDLVSAIRTAYDGKSVFSPEVTSVLLKPNSTSSTFNLTGRELEALNLMAEGLNNQEMAQRMVISVSTVKYHIVNILNKLGVETRSEALVAAAKNHLL